MRTILGPLILAMATASGIGSGMAQSLNADLNLGGGTGIGRHADGFAGTFGDPEVFPGPRDRAWPVSGYVPSGGLPTAANAPTYRVPGLAPGVPGYGAPPANPPVEFYFPPPR